MSRSSSEPVVEAGSLPSSTALPSRPCDPSFHAHPCSAQISEPGERQERITKWQMPCLELGCVSFFHSHSSFSHRGQGERGEKIDYSSLRSPTSVAISAFLFTC